jgi:hypothetical protein
VSFGVAAASLLYRGLDVVEDTDHFAFEPEKFDGEDRLAGMKNDVHVCRNAFDMAADDIAHAALDTIAFDGVAEDFAGGEADAGAGRHRRPGGAQSIKVTHRCREVLAPLAIDALVVGVFAEAVVNRDGRNYDRRFAMFVRAHFYIVRQIRKAALRRSTVERPVWKSWIVR